MSAAALVARLAKEGIDPDLLSEVAEALFAGEIEQKAIEGRRKADRERQANRRKGHAMSRDVTLQHVTSCDLSLDKKFPQTPSKIKPNQDPPLSPQKFQTAWNEMAGKHGLPKIEAIGGKRLKALRARIAEHGEDAVLRAISSVPASPHWLGVNGWLGNFDSLMRPDNCQRMLEGAYVAKPTTTEDNRLPGEPIPMWKHLRQERERKSAGARS